MQVFDLAVIGGGAAGFFGALQTAEMKPGSRIVILEKSNKLLSKVRISGGGRCNVTHACFEPGPLARHYPRGEKLLKNLFRSFQAKDTVAWFASKGVHLKVEEDGRMFPDTNSSETIIDCFLHEAQRHNITIEVSTGEVAVQPERERFTLTTQHGMTLQAHHVLVATGGHANPQFYQWLAALGHTVVPPIPSLFTLNDSQKDFRDLMGVAVPHAEVRIATTKFSETGPVLITHWGLSGPAVIKLSAWAAAYLHEAQYQCTALVSWIGPAQEEATRQLLHGHKAAHGKQRVYTNPLFSLPQRLWQKLCTLAAIEETKIWAELPQKNLNKLLEYLIRFPFQIKGKTTFKEEFVTCGGVDLKEINPETLESRRIKNLFFAGEVLNVDGETGGFNFQAAWTTSHQAARQIAASIQPGI
jgi:predicted Rossmann fold flavoprotein